jgi:hypothetical protein
MNERKYVLGVFKRMRGREKLHLLAMLAPAIISKRAYSRARGIFLKRINAGGLPLLNELLLEFAGAEIVR